MTREPDLKKIAAVIPAYDPDHRLISLCHELLSIGFSTIVIIDDGSSASAQTIFDTLSKNVGIIILHHPVNLGKGSALKTAFNHLLEMDKGFLGIITIDADGQHLSTDVLRLSRAFLKEPSAVVLGVRSFGNDIPFRSRFGNLLTRKIIYLLTGHNICDTQTGLRAIPWRIIPILKKLPGERYEYESTVLLDILKSGVKISSVSIMTIYLARNESSHFDPIRDSIRIYWALIRFFIASKIDSTGKMNVMSIDDIR